MTAFTQVRQRQEQRKRRRLGLAALVVAPALLALGVLGAATLIQARQAQHPEQVACYDAASVDANVTALRIRPGTDSPTEACAKAWRAGQVRQYDESAPRLIACASPKDGFVAGVFPVPGTGTCAQLDLPALLDPSGRPVPTRAADPASPGTEQRRATAEGLAGAIEAKVPALAQPNGCVPADQVEPVVRDELRRRGLDGWKVTVEPALRQPIRTSEVDDYGQRERHTGPCTLVDVDPRGREVRLSANTNVEIVEGSSSG